MSDYGLFGEAEREQEERAAARVEEFAARLREWMKRTKLNHTAVAILLGCQSLSVVNWARGHSYPKDAVRARLEDWMAKLDTVDDAAAAVEDIVAERRGRS